jgi:hypothetical protein
VCILYTYLVEKSYGKCKDGESRLSEILQRIPGRSEKGSDAERDERKMIEHGFALYSERVFLAALTEVSAVRLR